MSYVKNKKCAKNDMYKLRKIVRICDSCLFLHRKNCEYNITSFLLLSNRNYIGVNIVIRVPDY